MKLITLLTIGALGATGLLSWPHLQTSMHGGDPSAEMAAIAAELPPSAGVGTRYERRIRDVSYDVRKTESLVNPLVGILNFTEAIYVPPGQYHPAPFESELLMQMVFHREGGKWRFVQFLNRENGIDFTKTGGGIEFLSTREMRGFLGKYGFTPGPEPSPGKPFERPDEKTSRVEAATPPPLYLPRPLATPRATPDQATAMRQIMEKYGTKK